MLQELLQNSESQYDATKLEDKIINHFQEKIKILKGKTIRANVIYSSRFSPEEALRLADKKNIKLKMLEAALNLRNAIKDADVVFLSKELTVEDIYKGETDIPDLLKTFITYLISGPDINRNNTTSKTCRIESICQDIIYVATAWRKKPGKHLQLGMVMKSLTGSRKVIEILNRLGHGVSYNLVEEI